MFGISDTSKLFCVQVKDKISQRTLYMNFTSSPEVNPPDKDYNEAQYIAAKLEDGRAINEYLIPFQSSPLFLCRDAQKTDYVVLIRINDQFYKKRVKTSILIRDYAISVVMSEYMDSLNKPNNPQRIGHGFNLDHANYSIVNDKRFVEPSQEFASPASITKRIAQAAR